MTAKPTESSADFLCHASCEHRQLLANYSSLLSWAVFASLAIDRVATGWYQRRASNSDTALLHLESAAYSSNIEVCRSAG